ncbi:MAG TPA: DUF6263 family protein, partial [Planctomycetota bacterium]|nr:DUF6263 family protein [Planctomycetota bacterium]
NNDVKQTQKQTFCFSWTPEKREGDRWIIRQKIEGVAMDMDIGNQKISYDSSNTTDSAANPLGEFFKVLIGFEFRITLDTKTMKVIKVDGGEEFLKKVIGVSPQMKPFLDQILNDQTLKEMAEPTFGAIPGEVKAKGAAWKRESRLSMGPIGTYENTYLYTYEGRDGKLDKIRVEATSKYKEPTEVAAANGPPFKIKSAKLETSNFTGAMTFDPEKGRIESSEMRMELKGTLNIEVGGQVNEVSLTQNQTAKIETSDRTFVDKK